MPPEIGSPAPVQPARSENHRTLVRWILGVLVLAIIILVVWFLVEPSFWENLFSMKHVQKTPLPGAVTLVFPKPWQAPDKENLFGIVSYVPNTNAFSSLIAPSPNYVPIPYQNTTSPDGSLILAIQSTGSTTNFVAYSLQQQKVAYTIEHLSPGEVVTNAVWSPDGSHVAYRVVQLPDFPGAPAVKSSPKPASPTHTYVASKDGSGKVDLGSSVLPAMFSPDNSQLLVANSAMQRFAMYTIQSGTSNLLSTSTIPADAGPMLFDPTSKHLAIVSASGQLNLYALDWQHENLRKIYATNETASQAVFGKDGELLAVDAKSNLADVYYFYASTAGVRVNTYPFTLPASALLVGWLPNAK